MCVLSSCRHRRVVYPFLCPLDTCKFLHDRSDYKSGWQLDQEWEQQLYGQEGGALHILVKPEYCLLLLYSSALVFIL